MEPLNYDSFAQECCAELKILKDKFQEQYDLDWYENWFYNQATGLLTFFTNDVELNFKYFDVGSFSEKSGTWKWSWDNNYTLDKIKEETKLVKDFGQKSNFPKLTNGCFESNEYDAWEFTAIAAKLANGIGVYRPVGNDNLKIFLVILEFVDNKTAKNIKEKYIECSNHEYRRIAFVCQHLNHTDKIGFEEAFETFEDMELLEDDDFQAWCNECEIVRQKQDGWSDKAMEFSKPKVVCEKCYFEIKEFNLGHK